MEYFSQKTLSKIFDAYTEWYDQQHELTHKNDSVYYYYNYYYNPWKVP